VEQILVDLGPRSYPILIGPGLLRDEALLASCIPAEQVLVVTNEIVAPLYLDAFREKLRPKAASLVLPDGEQHKTLATFEKIIERLVALEFHRDACIVALGGGVIGDVAGFAAASYQRGIGFVQAPTTLLAQVDSSVGGKTAVNHRNAKNMIGAFYQPTSVLADTSTLGTLPPRELSAGLAEVIKHGLILDRDFFGWLELNMERLLELDTEALGFAVRRCCEIKSAIVAEDEREHGRRTLLNLGHTFGHALEAVGDFGRWLHGEAVAIGISMAARVSATEGLITAGACERIDRLLERARLPTRADGVDVSSLLSAMRMDKKADRSGIKLVLLAEIGKAVVVAAPDEDLLREVIVRHSSG
jgi:3-dehydroquinate synthase